MKDYKKILEGVIDIISATEKSDIGFANICTYIGENCPELAESEDERIRKEIVAVFKGEISYTSEENAQKYIAWLEKQEGCEHIKKEWLEHIKQSWYKEGFIDGKYSGGTSKEWTINDTTTLNELIDFLENGTAKLQHDLTRYANWLKIQFTPIEKQGDQKPTDTVEPKFKVGDIIRLKDGDGLEWTVEEVLNNGYYTIVCADRDDFIQLDDKWELVGQKTAWSEEDERMCQETIDWFEKKCFPYALESENPARESIKWLKSLNNRVYSQHKQEWSEEDEKIRDEICIYIGAKQDISLDVHNRWLSWLEKQGSEPNWCHHKVDLSNCSEEYRKAYYDGWNNCNMQHSQCKSESNDVIKCLINGLKFYYEDVEEATWGTEKFSMKVKDILSWLEKQREKPGKPVYYIRLGNIPSNEKSKIYRNEEEIGIEEGVSVYPAFESNGDIVIGLSLPITQTTLYTQQHLLEYESRPCYLVTGDCVGKGSDGEPLIKNVRIIKEIKPYRVKQDKENNTYVIKNTPNCGISCSKEEIPKWLEKQGSNLIENGYTNNKDIIKYADNYSHAIWHKLMDNFKNIKDYHIGCNDVSDIVLNAIIDAYNWLEKQGEQKPVDKVEPKFEVDNWIVYNRDDHSREILQIYDIRDGRYYFTDNVHLSWSIEECDEKSHLWTIQDARDGDVLVDEDNNMGIFEGIEGMCWHSYIYLGCNNCLYGFDTGGSHMQNNTKPATKEQRDTLEKAMADVGYTFDFEKKDLKKIHVIDEGKSEMDYCFTKMMNGEKVTPTWSKEDEKRMKKVVHILSLDGRISNAELLSMYDWLISLKLQNTWKPSDEQMNLLEELVEDNNQRYFYPTLKSLYNDLKKLKEE